ncbi:MAG: hypothetical protein HND44_14935 [Chloroflexi bacterium]|nr:hypothetical protein [Ardenticatenaceae bacterium]NOG35841.1 hypothetical protein [Chloroflexota bacterium]GIK55462.1 MAG: hypothetical protein BroJett015_11250 [Chloroflexota bacterium]
MTKKDWLVSITAGLVLALATLYIHLGREFSPIPGAVLAQNEAQTIPDQSPAIMMIQPEAQKVVESMLNSHARWTTLQAEAITTWYMKGDVDSSWLSKVMIVQPVQARFETSLAGQKEANLWLMNGDQRYERDLVNNVEEQKRLPAFATDPAALARLPVQIEEIALAERIVYRHPIGMLVPSPVADYIYPVGLAQRGGQYTLIGEEQIAGRIAWILEWVQEEVSDSHPPSLKQQFWVDQETGVVLKARSYVGLNLAELYEETVFTSISYDQPVAPESFVFPTHK